MKNNQILIVIGVIALVLIIANWNKIFGKKPPVVKAEDTVSGRYFSACGKKLGQECDTGVEDPNNPGKNYVGKYEDGPRGCRCSGMSSAA